MAFRVKIPQDSLKAFRTSLEAIHRFGDELHFEAKRDQLIMWTINPSMTAQAVVRLSPRLFEEYKIKRQGTDTVCCRVLTKTLYKIIKRNQSGSVQHMELQMKTTESAGGEARDHRLNVKFVFQSGVTKTHSLWYQEDDVTQVLFDKSRLAHELTIDPGLLLDSLIHIHPQIQDVSLIFTTDTVYLKTSWDESVIRPGGKPFQSNFKFARSDFMTCRVNGARHITVAVKEFKAALVYAVDACSSLRAKFGDPGAPVVFTINESGLVHADLAVMAQFNGDSTSQASDGHSINNGSVISGENSFMSRGGSHQPNAAPHPAPMPAAAPPMASQHQQSRGRRSQQQQQQQQQQPKEAQVPTRRVQEANASRSPVRRSPAPIEATRARDASPQSPSWSRDSRDADPQPSLGSLHQLTLSSSLSGNPPSPPRADLHADQGHRPPLLPTQLQRHDRDDDATTDEDEQLFEEQPPQGAGHPLDANLEPIGTPKWNQW
ncbi:Rad9-domain-containing protein [Gongronella butleri]|nr:Rad9-domain-containing protein [Gongronella butleri]